MPKKKIKKIEWRIFSSSSRERKKKERKKNLSYWNHISSREEEEKKKKKEKGGGGQPQLRAWLCYIIDDDERVFLLCATFVLRELFFVSSLVGGLFFM